MLAPDLDPSAVVAVAALRDPLGIVSIYVDRDPREQASDRPPWVVEVHKRMRELRSQVEDRVPRSERARVLSNLDEIEAFTNESIAPGRWGRGRAVFGALHSGRRVELTFQLPTETVVVLDDAPYLWPLARTLHLGHPMGLVSVSRSEISVHDWRVGAASHVATWSFDESTSDWREMKGPAAANPQLPQQTAPQRDRFEQRLEQHVVEFLAEHGASVRRVGDVQGWDVVVIAGDPRLTSAVAGAFPDDGSGASVIEIQKQLEGLSPDQLAQALWPIAQAERVRMDEALVRRVLDEAFRGGSAAVGLRDTVAALVEGRVSHLLLSGEHAWSGVVGPDRSLYVDMVQAREHGVTDPQLEPHLAERMIVRALETGAEIVLLDPERAAPLGGSDGIAALLRWRERHGDQIVGG